MTGVRLQKYNLLYDWCEAAELQIVLYDWCEAAELHVAV
jgi:hypothetical protein